MSETIEIERAARAPAPHRHKPKIAIVTEHFFPPVIDGSTFVYKSWIDFLAQTYDVYAILFDSYGGEIESAERYLAEKCKAHIILPGTSRSRLWKVLRAAARFITGALFAPRWIEELGRGGIQATIAAFIARHEPDVFLINKLIAVPLFGQANLRRRNAAFFLDTHDDFVAHSAKERQVLRDLMNRFPQLKNYARFRDMSVRHRLTRLTPRRARAQEARLCAFFDCVMSSSADDTPFYQKTLSGIVPCVHIGWPPHEAHATAEVCEAPNSPPPFDIGFIGSEYLFNIEAVFFLCTEILPLIRRHRPDFKVLIAGRIAEPLACIGQSWPGVEVCGYLPEARSFYDRVGVIVVPLLSGTGVSIKTLEALECGKPVVATRVGARGINGRAEHSRLFIADKAEDFARAVLAACASPKAAPPPPADGVPSSAFRLAFEELLGRYGPRGEPVATAAHSATDPALTST